MKRRNQPLCDGGRRAAPARRLQNEKFSRFPSAGLLAIIRYAITAFALLVPTSLIAQPAGMPTDPWTLTRDVELVSRWPRGDRMQEDRVTADLYRPPVEGRVPAAVIINSSGGVSAHTELNYARVLARHGMAALVVDSFAPRGVRRTGDDQTRVAQTQSNADAVAGFRWLAAQSWVDASRIVVMGMSRGGEAAYSVALDSLRRHLRATDIRFAAHVAMSPGGCNFQQRDARSNGAPIFFMLAELDDGTPVMPCVAYIQRMRAAGNSNIRWAVYPGVFHAYEGTGGVGFVPNDWTGRACAGRFWRDERYTLYLRSSGLRATQGNQTEYLFRTCLQTGYTVGGDDRVKAQAIADLIQFLRDVEVLRDEAARAIVPECGTIPDGKHRRNCVRARNGWTGDLVALGRAYRNPGGIARDDALAARLFRLAADRGHPQAQWELSTMYRQGAGVARDLVLAQSLTRKAAGAGDPPAMNTMGVLARDGIGQPRDEGSAVHWFRQAADLRNSYALDNLGRMHWQGRGGLAVDHVEAVRLFRQSAYYENPWGRLHLAEALEAGSGVAQDVKTAIELYRLVREQDREAEAKQRAIDALSRLEPQPKSSR
jgi:TPR repeat protein/dienelactone hydrolase